LWRTGASDGRGTLIGLFGEKMIGVNDGDSIGCSLGNVLEIELDGRLGNELGVVLD
jgi:hypothetical protein